MSLFTSDIYYLCSTVNKILVSEICKSLHSVSNDILRSVPIWQSWRCVWESYNLLISRYVHKFKANTIKVSNSYFHSHNSLNWLANKALCENHHSFLLGIVLTSSFQFGSTRKSLHALLFFFFVVTFYAPKREKRNTVKYLHSTRWRFEDTMRKIYNITSQTGSIIIWVVLFERASMLPAEVNMSFD